MTTREPPRKPDFNVAAMNSAVRALRIGGAWKNDDGSILVKLDPFVHLNNDAGDLQIRLFPVRAQSAFSKTGPSFDDMDGDIPF